MAFRLRCDLSSAGFYTWDIANNCLWGDATMAKLLGLPISAVDKGVPLEKYIDALHAEDRASFVCQVKEAVINSLPFEMSYRMTGAGTEIAVTDVGRCFRHAEGVPLLFTGIVVPRLVASQATLVNSNIEPLKR